MAKRVHHKLVQAKYMVMPSNLRNITFTGKQKKWICKCGSGWLSISAVKPEQAFKDHVAQTGGIIA